MGLITAGLSAGWLCSASCSGSVFCSGIISTLGGSIGFSAFSIISGGSGGALGGVSFSGISRSGTACGVCTSSFFFGFIGGVDYCICQLKLTGILANCLSICHTSGCYLGTTNAAHNIEHRFIGCNPLVLPWLLDKHIIS